MPLSPKTNDKIRNYILVRNSIKAFLGSNHSSDDETVAPLRDLGTDIQTT